MSQRLIRIYKQFDISEIKKHLLIYGDLSAQCAQCNHMGLKLESLNCTECKTDFKYIAFRNVKDHFPKIQKIVQDRPQITLVDFDDFKRLTGALKAEEFLR